MAFYNHEMVHSGAETLQDQLNGTPVERAGVTGLVRAAVIASDGTNTVTLKGRMSGKEVIPRGSHAMQKALAADFSIDSQEFMYVAQLNPGEELDLEVVAATASTTVVSVRTD